VAYFASQSDSRHTNSASICMSCLQQRSIIFLCLGILFFGGLANAQTLHKTDVLPMEVDGRAKALEEVEVISQIQGIVVARNFKLGQAVKLGDVLIRIGPELFRIKVAHARIRLQNARISLETIDKEIERIRPIVEKKLTSMSVMYNLNVARDVEIGEFEEAEVELKQAEFELSQTVIKSPIDGFVSQVNVDVGDLVSREQGLVDRERGQMMTVVKYDPIRVVIGVEQSLDLRLYQNQLAGKNKDLIFALELPTGQKYPHPGKYSGSYHRVDPESDKVQHELVFPNPELLLVPGHAVKVRISAR
jgi:membrane fusion protein (multidrug efflux system)